MQNSTIVTIKQDGIIQSADKNCAKLFGYTIDEMVGQPIQIIVPSPYKQQHQTYMDNYAKTGTAKILGKSRVIEGQHKDGSIFPIRLTVSKVGEGTDAIFVGMIDKLEDKSATITINANGLVVSCNHNVQELFGYKANEIIGNNVNVLMPSPHHADHDKYISNYVNGGQPRMIGRVRNVPAKHKNGSIFPISMQVEEIKVGAIQLFRGKIERVDEIEAVVTLNELGTIIECNQIFVLPLLGYSSKELLGTHIDSLIPPQQNQDGDDSSSSSANIPQNHHHSSSTSSNNNHSHHSSSAKEPDTKKQRTSSSSSVPVTTNGSDSSGGQPQSSSWWQTPGRYKKQLQHHDSSFFPVIIEITRFQDQKSGQPAFSAKIKRADYDKSKSNAHSPKMIGPYFISKTVGQGSYGKVKLAYHNVTRDCVAIKILQKSRMKEIDLQRAIRETSILQQLKHPNIAQLYEVVETDNTLNIVMEFAARTLLSYVLEKNGLGEEEARKFFLQLLSAIRYCHERNIIHRDIKHQNILLDDKYNCKLIDFGLSNFMEEGKLRSTFCGTPAYAAPEMIIGKKYTGPEVDIWSMGVVLYSMITGVFSL